MKSLFFIFLTFLFVSCGQKTLKEQSDPKTPENPEVTINNTPLIENQYFYNDYSENQLDIAEYEDWYGEDYEPVNYLDQSFYNSTDSRLELDFTDSSGVSAFQYIFHNTSGLSVEGDNREIEGYQERTPEISPLVEGDVVTVNFYYTVPYGSGLNGVYVSLLWLDGNNKLGRDVTLRINDRPMFYVGSDGYIPVFDGESGVISATFSLSNPDDVGFDYSTIMFDILIEGQYSKPTDSKLYIDAFEILRN